ncbi:MAG: UxaA family hydrolase [Planctomycetes bacterium]|nr:UxaA family hydrolase [Planctomycetota bacterium]
MSIIKIKGYLRKDGLVGIRNHIIVMSSVSCANFVVEQIARTDADIIPVTHQHGCTHMGADTEQVLRSLSGTCNNPNVGGVLLVGLGCESASVNKIVPQIDCNGKLIKTLVIQEIGEIQKIMKIAYDSLKQIKEYVSKQQRSEFNISNLTIGLECGGSDPFSGITANPAVGLVSDKLVELGATVILSEIPEMIGAEGVLESRIPDEAVKQKILDRIKDYVQMIKDAGGDPRGCNPAPGNIKAGLSSIEEKSLGCVIKGGHSNINEFVEYARRPRCKGLVVMDTPGNDPESVTGMAAGGANLILFTTGTGTPVGNPVAPVIKISSNTKMYQRMSNFIDIDAGKVIGGTEVEAVADEMFEFIIDVCNGRLTAAEVNNCREFSINRIGPTF